ncbi:alpha/beta hydrolase [Apibacter sp.]|uniref:alpha/beta fold hydrolase n=1 Tax=Apibacter sp. TaxID=2023709 RepID=UPI0025F2895B|nr:alpha/beta hydrolase [Apibacter sp.]MCT6868602.1 alpha/beta hydrolase [Apibacter sp.]
MLYYRDKGKGKTIVFLHGFLENSRMWRFFQNKLSKKYRVIAIDLPGHGRSSKKTNEVNRMEDMAKKVNKVLEHLKIDEVIISGHSMGGYVALAFAEQYKYKVSGLGLFYSTTLPDDDIKKEQRLKAAEVVVKNPKEFFRLSIPNLFAPQNVPKLQSEIKTAIKWAKHASLTGISAALKGMRLRKDRTDVVRDLGKPIFIIIGKYDNAIKNSELIKKMEGVKKLSIYELETGHMGALEAPEECLEILQTWLKQNYK